MSDVPMPAVPENVVRIGPGCSVRADEIEWRFEPSGGPGGQHANKSSTRAVARLDLAASPSLSDEHRDRLVSKLGPVVTVVADDTRSQIRNRALALERLRSRLAGALARPVPRRATKPSRGAKERRLQAKRERSQTKQGRQRKPTADD